MGTTAFSGPIKSGDRADPLSATVLANQGLSVMEQSAPIQQNSTTAVSVTFNVPKYSKIMDVFFDTQVAWDSATSATGTIGTAAAGTQYGGAIDLKATAGRLRPTFTGAQLAAMDNTGTNEAVVFTATVSGATAAGNGFVTIVYAQTERTA